MTDTRDDTPADDEQRPDEGPDVTELPDDPAYAGGEEIDEDAERVRGG
jgi:hypothetical protein